MGIKTVGQGSLVRYMIALKNLPTTWGLRRKGGLYSYFQTTLKNLPATRG